MLARSAILSIVLLTATAAAAGPACWAPSDLAHRKGDERVQKGVMHALIAPPKRTLAEFTPVPQRGAIRRVSLPAGKKLVALTFDLCEQRFEVSGYQDGIVDTLRQNGIKATFFMGGKWMLSHRERTQQLMADPPVRGGQPYLGAQEPAGDIGSGTRRRDRQGTVGIRANPRGAGGEAMHCRR
jgi:peptidoglycan/xylan/chitin deacetylase (PgdA/CDA1 family)